MSDRQRKRTPRHSRKAMKRFLQDYTEAGPVIVSGPDGSRYEVEPYRADQLARVRAGKRVNVRVTKSIRRKVYLRDMGHCRYCGDPCDPDDFEIDHVRPRSSGGLTVEANLVTSCRPCNKRKQTSLWTPTPLSEHSARIGVGTRITLSDREEIIITSHVTAYALECDRGYMSAAPDEQDLADDE